MGGALQDDLRFVIGPWGLYPKPTPRPPSIGAEIITNTIFGVPSFRYDIMGFKSVF